MRFCFGFPIESLSCFFPNCYFTFEISSASGRYWIQQEKTNFTAYLWQFLLLLRLPVFAVYHATARCVAFIYLPKTRNSRKEKMEEKPQTESECENRKPKTETKSSAFSGNNFILDICQSILFYDFQVQIPRT